MFAPADAPVHPSVRRWLLLVAGMIFAMVVLGGLTRLTESGLSMTEWRPLFGWLPPMSDEAWQRLFDLYRETPQYRQVFPDLTVGGFKAIFWLEYLHRLFGRLIGVVFLAGFVTLLLRRRLLRRLVPPLVALFVLGGLQGALGWYMVASGLVDRPFGQPLPARRPSLPGDHPLRLDCLADRPHGPAGNPDRRRSGRRRPRWRLPPTARSR